MNPDREALIKSIEEKAPMTARIMRSIQRKTANGIMPTATHNSTVPGVTVGSGGVRVTTPKPFKLKLGDKLQAALEVAGITEDKVSTWLGKPCGCAERKNKLNKLSDWIESSAKSTAEKSINSLKSILGLD